MKKLTFYLIFAIIFSNYNYLNAQWSRTEGIYGGTVNALAVSGNTIFAGTEYEGVYKSTDNGVTWSQTGLKEGCIKSLAVKDNYVIAGCGYNNLNYIDTNKIYVSSDQGQSWICTYSDIKWVQTILSIIFKNEKIYAISNRSYTYGGSYPIFYSENNGISWSTLNVFKNSIGSLLESNGTYIFAQLSSSVFGGVTGLFRTSNNGQNWTRINGYSSYPYQSAISTSGNKIVYFINDSLFISTNNGDNWNSIYISFNINSLVINGINIFAGTDDGVYVSTDEGNTWNPTTLQGRDVLSVVYNGSTLFAGLKANGMNTLKDKHIISKTYFNNSNNQQFINGGLYSSINNGLTWTTSFYNATVRCIAKSGTNMVAGTWGLGGAYYSTNDGINWLHSDLDNTSVLCLLSSGNNLYAGELTGVYKSTNDGQNWSKAHTENIGHVHSILNKNGIYFTATANGHFYGQGIGGIYKSEDNCYSWTQIWSSTPLYSNCYAIVTSNNNIFAGGGHHYNPDLGFVLKSTNDGQNWIKYNSIVKTVISLAVKDNCLFAGTASDGIYRSSDEGMTWTSVGLAGQFVESIIVEGNAIIASGYGVYISYDNGNTWIQKNTGFTQIPTVGALYVANNYLYAGTYYSSAWRRPYSEIINNVPEMPMLISPLSNSTGITITPTLRWNSVFGATQYSFQISMDENFTNIIHSGTTASTQYIVPSSVLTNNTKYYWKVRASNANGSSPYSLVWNFTTKPPTSVGPWTLYNTGVPYSLFGVDFSTFDTQIGVAVGEGGTVIRTTNGGEEWTLAFQNINIWMNDVKFDPNIPGNVWAAGMGGVIVKSTNNGLTWSVARGFDTPTNTIRGIGIPENYPDYIAFVGYAGTFFETTNNGNSFNKRTDIIFTMHSIAFSPNYGVNGKAIISGTDGLVWNTSNYGTNWVSRPTNRYDYMNDVVFTDANTAMICGNNGTILRTTNAGNTWTLNQQSLTTEHLRSIDVFMPKVTVCGDNGKIMTSNDGGLTFLDQLAGEPRHLYGVCLRSVTEGTIVGEVGTSFAGAMYFSLMNGAVSISENENEIPTVFELKQNYPNPFNPVTKITYLLPKSTNVSLIVYDILGREIKRLVNSQIMKAGKHTVEFGGQEFSSGIYFYRLQTSEFVDTKRMVLIK